MRTGLILALTFFGVAAVGPFNPGLVFRIHKKHFADIIKVAVPIMNPYLKNNVIEDEIHVGALKVYNTHMSVEDITSKQVEITDITQAGFIHFEIRNPQFSMHSNGEIDMKIFKSHGTIDAQGTISETRMKVSFPKFNQTIKDRPYTNLDLEEIRFDKNSLKIHLNFKGIPDGLINEIIKLFKDALVGSLRNAIIKYFRTNGNILINKGISTYYPLSVHIKPLGISLQTALNSSPSIDDHDVVLGIDGTFFDPAKGYHRDTDAPKIEGEALENFFGDASLTSYTINSFFDAIRSRDIGFSFNGFNISLQINKKQPISISSRGIHSKQTEVILRGKKGDFAAEFRMDFGATLWLAIHHSLDFFLDTDIRDFTLNAFDFNTTISIINYLKPLIPYAINAYLRYFHKFSVDIPDVVFPLDLKVQDLGLFLTQDIMQLGLSVRIDHVTQLIASGMQGLAHNQAVTSASV